MKMHKVLIPLDDSEFSLGVLPHVTNLLEPDRNELYLLHVMPKPNSIVVDDEIWLPKGCCVWWSLAVCLEDELLVVFHGSVREDIREMCTACQAVQA